jgi:hypothetical protein
VKAHLVRRDGARAEQLVGTVLTRDVRGANGQRAFAKGHVLLDGDVHTLLALDWDELHVIETEPGEIHEGEAGQRIAIAAAGDGTIVGAMGGGHWPIATTHRGVLRVDVERLARVNAIDGACVYTLYDGQIVDAGETVAHAKITPFVIDETRIEMVERITRDSERLVRVLPFRAMIVAAVVQETLGERAMTRFRDALAEKITWFGSRLLEPSFVPPAGDAVAAALEDAVRSGAQVIVMAGTKAMDPLDPAFVALDRLGVHLDRFGAPAHPGSLFWIARLEGIPVLGMPSCGLFSQATVFDLVLPRVLAGERVGREELGALGHGGLITRDVTFRFPRYREARGRGEVE